MRSSISGRSNNQNHQALEQVLKEVRCLRIASRSIRSEMAEMIYRLKKCEKENILPNENVAKARQKPPHPRQHRASEAQGDGNAQQTEHTTRSLHPDNLHDHMDSPESMDTGLPHSPRGRARAEHTAPQAARPARAQVRERPRR